MFNSFANNHISITFCGDNHCKAIIFTISFVNSSTINNALNCNKFNNPIKCLSCRNFIRESFMG